MSEESLCSFGRMLNNSFVDSQPHTFEQVKNICSFSKAYTLRRPRIQNNASFDFENLSKEIIDLLENSSRKEDVLHRCQRIISEFETLIDVSIVQMPLKC